MPITSTVSIIGVVYLNPSKALPRDRVIILFPLSLPATSRIFPSLCELCLFLFHLEKVVPTDSEILVVAQMTGTNARKVHSSCRNDPHPFLLLAWLNFLAGIEIPSDICWLTRRRWEDFLAVFHPPPSLLPLEKWTIFMVFTKNAAPPPPTPQINDAATGRIIFKFSRN